MFVLLRSRSYSALLCLTICLSVQPARAEKLSFDAVLSAAQKNSFDLKIAREGVQANRASVDEALADYYPHLSLRFGNEYVHVFHENGNVVSVGDAIIADTASGYKHSLIAGFSYNLFDFGVRRLTVENAGRQVQIANLHEQQVYIDLRKDLLDHYSSALKLQKQIHATEAILERRNRIFRLSRQLRQAGTLGREQVGSAALSLAETLEHLEDLKVRYEDALGSLSLYTRQTYRADNATLADLPLHENLKTGIDLEVLPEEQVFQRQIDSKQTELSIARRSMLPKLTLYGSYRMFGSDADSFSRSASSLDSRDTSITVYLEWPLFSGFADRAKTARLEHELAGLRYRKQKRKAELTQEYTSLVTSYRSAVEDQDNRRQQLVQMAQVQTDAERLAARQITDRINFHNQMIQLTRQQLEVELRQIEYAASALALDFFNKAAP